MYIPSDLIVLLHQDEWWRPKIGPPIRLEDMEQSHRYNLYQFLRRNAERLPDAHFSYWLYCTSGLDMDKDYAWDILNDLEREFETIVRDPQRWLANTPFMRKLGQLLHPTRTLDGPRW
jgi:hypothetical protein